MKSFIKPSYTFTPGISGVGNIDLSSIANFDVKRLVAIINQTDGVLIYSTANPSLRFTTQAAGVVTLFADTSTMDGTDILQVIYEDTGRAAEADSSPVALSTEDFSMLNDIELALNFLMSPMTPSYQEDLTVTTSVETITAPLNARWCKIMTECTGGDMRVKIGGTASATSGLKFQDGRSEDYIIAGDISYCMEAGTGKIYVQYGV